MHSFFDAAGTTFSLAPNAVPSMIKPSFYSFALPTQNQVFAGGVKVNMDDNGNVWGAIYDTGAEFRHNDSFSVVKSSDSKLWFGDCFGAFHPLD